MLQRSMWITVLAKLLFRLRHVPEDEAEEVREVNDSGHVGFVELDEALNLVGGLGHGQLKR